MSEEKKLLISIRRKIWSGIVAILILLMYVGVSMAGQLDIAFTVLNSGSLLRDKGDTTHSAVIYNQKGLEEFLYQYPIDLKLEKGFFEKYILIVGFSDSMWGITVDGLKHWVRPGSARLYLDLHDKGIIVKALLPPKGKKHSAWCVVSTPRGLTISYVRVREGIPGLCRQYGREESDKPNDIGGIAANNSANTLGGLLVELKKECEHPTSPDKPEWLSYLSPTERIRWCILDELQKQKESALPIVMTEAKTAKGEYYQMLTIVMAVLGDSSSITTTADLLIKAKSPAVRVCAAKALRVVKDRSTISALKQAMHDPYHREDGSCVKVGDGMCYPVRIVAGDALAELGLTREQTDGHRSQ